MKQHTDDLIAELQYRHILPFKIFPKVDDPKKPGKQKQLTRTHPIPNFLNLPNEMKQFNHAHFSGLNFTALKDLLMADEERRWLHMIDPLTGSQWRTADVAEHFDAKSFRILCPDVNFEKTEPET